MPFRLDLKTLPELAVLPPEQRRQIERQALFLAAWDWRTLMTVPLIIGCVYLAGYLGPEVSEAGEMIWPGCGAVVGVLLFISTLLVRANHHAVRLAASFDSTGVGATKTPVPRPPDQAPLARRQPLPAWLRMVGLFGLSVGPVTLYFGIASQDWVMGCLGALPLAAGFLAVTRGAVCRACRSLNVTIGERGICCAVCGVPFATNKPTGRSAE